MLLWLGSAAVALGAIAGCSGDDAGSEGSKADAQAGGSGGTSSGGTTGDASVGGASGSGAAGATGGSGGGPGGSGGSAGGDPNSGDCSTATQYAGYTLIYCTGYDTMEDLLYGGNGQLGDGELSTTTYKTPPGSFYSKPASVSAGIRSEVQYGDDETPDEGIIEWDVMYEVVIPNNGHSLQFHPYTSGGSASPGLFHIDGEFTLVTWKDGGATYYPSNTSIQTGHWYHMKLELAFGSSGYMRLFIDGVAAVDEDGIQVGDGSGQYLKVGYNGWDGDSEDSRIYYDNLRVYEKE